MSYEDRHHPMPDEPSGPSGNDLDIAGPEPDEVETECDYAGHEWADAGGGLLICTECEAEKWA